MNIPMKNFFTPSLAILLLVLTACKPKEPNPQAAEKVRIIIDTDANNELDDQHALAYAFANQNFFRIEGITVNNTQVGEGIEGQWKEAVRITRLFDLWPQMPVLKGADGNYEEISKIMEGEFDGKEAVDFIIEHSSRKEETPLTVIALGKLTNIALALDKDPGLKDRIKVVWLGSNYPDPGEYNLVNDPASLNRVLDSKVDFEMALVAYGREDGTAAVSISIDKVRKDFPGMGPVIIDSIEGRNGGYFRNFGDYAVNLWENIELYGEEGSRSLFDLAAVAIVKNPDYAEKIMIPPSRYKEGGWKEISTKEDSITMVHNFNREAILNDFYRSLSR